MVCGGTIFNGILRCDYGNGVGVLSGPREKKILGRRVLFEGIYVCIEASPAAERSQIR
jgi:hypothetical protein